MIQLLRRFAHMVHAEHGFASVGAVFILMAVAAGGATFGYAATHQSAQAGLRLEASAQDAFEQTSHVVLITSPVYVQDVNDDGAVDGEDTLTVDVTVAPGAVDVDLATMTAFLTTSDERIAVTPQFSDADGVLNRGETTQVTFAPPATLEPGERFSIELTPADGPTATANATMAMAVSGLMTLRY